MSNLISAEIFKIKKGKTLLGVGIGLVAVTLLIAMILVVMRSPVLSEQLRNNPAIMNQDDVVEMDALTAMMPSNGGEFLSFMYREGASIFVFLLLPFIISVFASDYRTGAFRNLLSHSLSREKIYIGKLLTTLLLTVATVIVFGILNALVGVVIFGAGGFSLAAIGSMLLGLLLMLPILAAFVCVGHAIVALTKSSGNSIAVYLVGIMIWTTVLQIAAFLLPGVKWLMQLDLASMVGKVVNPELLNMGDLFVPMVFSFILIIGSYIIGINKYKTTDFDFN